MRTDEEERRIDHEYLAEGLRQLKRQEELEAHDRDRRCLYGDVPCRCKAPRVRLVEDWYERGSSTVTTITLGYRCDSCGLASEAAVVAPGDQRAHARAMASWLELIARP